MRAFCFVRVANLLSLLISNCVTFVRQIIKKLMTSRSECNRVERELCTVRSVRRYDV
jgi:hypothetical protein